MLDSHQEDHSVGGIAADRLRSIIERVERLEEERKALSSEIKDIFSEAKSGGFDVKVIGVTARSVKNCTLSSAGYERIANIS